MPVNKAKSVTSLEGPPVKASLRDPGITPDLRLPYGPQGHWGQQNRAVAGGIYSRFYQPKLTFLAKFHFRIVSDFAR